jgi:hypothetical protein
MCYIQGYLQMRTITPRAVVEGRVVMLAARHWFGDIVWQVRFLLGGCFLLEGGCSAGPVIDL